MSLKSKINIAKEQEKEEVYPFLAEYKTCETQSFIVMFNAPDSGMVVWTHNFSRPIGEYSQHWNFTSQRSNWKVLPRNTELTITQQHAPT